MLRSVPAGCSSSRLAVTAGGRPQRLDPATAGGKRSILTAKEVAAAAVLNTCTVPFHHGRGVVMTLTSLLWQYADLVNLWVGGCACVGGCH